MSKWWNGRHVRFRCVWSNPWGFESLLRHFSLFLLNFCSQFLSHVFLLLVKTHWFSRFHRHTFIVRLEFHILAYIQAESLLRHFSLFLLNFCSQFLSHVFLLLVKTHWFSRFHRHTFIVRLEFHILAYIQAESLLRHFSLFLLNFCSQFLSHVFLLLVKTHWFSRFHRHTSQMNSKFNSKFYFYRCSIL